MVESRYGAGDIGEPCRIRKVGLCGEALFVKESAESVVELRRIPPPSHYDLLARSPESKKPDLRNRGYSRASTKPRALAQADVPVSYVRHVVCL